MCSGILSSESMAELSPLKRKNPTRNSYEQRLGFINVKKDCLTRPLFSRPELFSFLHNWGTAPFPAKAGSRAILELGIPQHTMLNHRGDISSLQQSQT